MPIQLLVRFGVVALCAAGVALFLVTYRSERKGEDAFAAAIDGRPVSEIEELFEESRPLNPGAARELTLSRLHHVEGNPDEAERWLQEAANEEPSNVRVWYFGSRLARSRGDRREAERRWAAARSLDPTLPAALPPPL